MSRTSEIRGGIMGRDRVEGSFGKYLLAEDWPRTVFYLREITDGNFRLRPTENQRPKARSYVKLSGMTLIEKAP